MIIFAPKHEKRNLQPNHICHWLRWILCCSVWRFGSDYLPRFFIGKKCFHLLRMALKDGFVPKFLQRRTFDMFMFGYVDGIHTELPSVSIKKAVAMFRKRYNLSVDDFNEDSACREYQRIKEEIKQYDKERMAAV